MNIDITRIRLIEGLEDFKIEALSTGYPFIKMINSNKLQVETKKSLGTVYIGQSPDIEVLVPPETEFSFIPLGYYSEWAIFDATDTSKVTKRSYSKTGFWSDGTKVLPAELAWNAGVPPVAIESLNFIVMPISELSRPKIDAEDSPRIMVLPFAFTSKTKSTEARNLLNLIASCSDSNGLSAIRHAAYKIKSMPFANDKGVWYEFTSSSFIKVVNNDAKLIVDKHHPEVKQLLANQRLIASTIPVQEEPIKIESQVSSQKVIEVSSSIPNIEVSDEVLF